MLLDYYNGRHILIPGGAGFVGTSLCWKLVSVARPAKIYVIIRGEEERLWAQWRYVLPDAQYRLLRDSNCIVPISGDASIPDTLGLSSATLASLRESVTVVINLVSKTKLLDSLSTIQATNIDPALFVAEVAATFPCLERFVWMSSAYANAHLHWRDIDNNADFTRVGETMYPLDDSVGDSERELAEIKLAGYSETYKQNFFPSDHGYAKHLAERLLLSRFRGAGAGSRRLPHLLIVRPSCIGPALREPSPGFEVLGSAPITTYISFTMDESANRNRAHPLPNHNGAKFETLVNECPVDLVTNRILAHTAHGTQGFVHAVVSEKHQLNLGSYWKEYISTVPYALQPKVEWVDRATLLAHFHSRSTGITDEIFDSHFGPVSRAFTFLGASYIFDDNKTERLWQGMTETEKEALPLMEGGKDELICALRTRRKRSRAHIATELKKYGFFSSPDDEGSGRFRGHLESDFLAAAQANTAEVHFVGKDTNVGSTNMAIRARRMVVGRHRFPQRQLGIVRDNEVLVDSS